MGWLHPKMKSRDGEAKCYSSGKTVVEFDPDTGFFRIVKGDKRGIDHIRYDYVMREDGRVGLTLTVDDPDWRPYFTFIEKRG